MRGSVHPTDTGGKFKPSAIRRFQHQTTDEITQAGDENGLEVRSFAYRTCIMNRFVSAIQTLYLSFTIFRRPQALSFLVRTG